MKKPTETAPDEHGQDERSHGNPQPKVHSRTKLAPEVVFLNTNEHEST